MPNSKHTLTTLLTNIDVAFKSLPEESYDVYKTSYSGALNLSTSHQTQIYGYQPRTLLNCLRSALQATSTASNTPEVYHGVWNPVIATVFNVLEKVILDLSDVEDGLSQVKETGVFTKPIQGTLTRSAPIGEAPRPSQKVKPSTAKATPSKPVVAKVSSKCGADVLQRVRSNKEKDAGPVFKNLPHVKCTKPQCPFCVKLWQSLELSKCSSVRCHKSGTTCNRDGWSAHVFPTMWLAMKNDHDFGLPFRGIDTYLKVSAKKMDATSSPAVTQTTTYAQSIKRPAPNSDSNAMDVTVSKSPRYVDTKNPLDVSADDIWITTPPGIERTEFSESEYEETLILDAESIE
jgi:hypothetical protein